MRRHGCNIIIVYNYYFTHCVKRFNFYTFVIIIITLDVFQYKVISSRKRLAIFAVIRGENIAVVYINDPRVMYLFNNIITYTNVDTQLSRKLFANSTIIIVTDVLTSYHVITDNN